MKDALARRPWPLGLAANPKRGVARLLVAATLLSVSLTTAPVKALETVDLHAPGASEDLMARLRASSLVMTAQAEGRTGSVELMAAARAEYGRLIGLLYEAGHFAPVIHVRVDGREATHISPLSAPRQIDRISIDIELGPRFSFGRAEIGPQAPGTVLPTGFAPGQAAQTPVMRAAVRSSLDAWRNQGHPHARVGSQDIVANHAREQLNVNVRLAPGPRLRFGELRTQGTERTRPERLRAIAGLPEGEIHSPAAIEQAEDRLRRTGAFNSVVLRTSEQANPDGSVDVVAEVDEALPRRLGFGAEIDSEAGLRLSGFWLHRNLFGGAERLRIEASVEGIGSRIGGIGYSLDARLTRPATLNRDTDLELGLLALSLNERDYSADALEAEAMLTRRFSPQLTASAGVNLRYERASFGGRSYRFGTVGLPIDVTRDTRDNRLNATQGHYLWAEAMPFAGFGSADSGLRLRFDGRLYQDFGTEGRFVLATRAQMGAIYGARLQNTPRGFLFYSGGGGTVRGLPYQSLGVTSGGVTSGGLGFAALSAELRMRVNDDFSLVAFADAGHVSQGALAGRSDWHAGGGFGVRYNTPIGPLRFDVATPLRRNASAAASGPIQLYLGIGQAF